MILEHLKNHTVVLASKSPRRQELLKGMGVPFVCLTKETPESHPDMPFDEVPGYLSRQKSMAFDDRELPEHYLLITADTVVIAGDEILGKPADREEAAPALGPDPPCGNGGHGAVGHPVQDLFGEVEGDVRPP